MQKPYDSALIVGRFQHPHIGHEHLINSALAVSGRVLILLGSAQEVGTVRNPFSTSTRTEMIRAMYPDRETVLIGEIPDLDNGDEKLVTADWARHVMSMTKIHLRKIPEVMVYGGESQNTNWFSVDENISFMTRGMSELIVSRTRHVISATKMRNYLLKDEFADWSKFASQHLHKHYDRLRGELMNSPGYAEIIRKSRAPREGWTDKPNLLV